MSKELDRMKRKLHYDTIKKHIDIVCDLCCKMGIPSNGKAHDLSKLSKDEFKIYRYADGKRSPHDNARDKLGYSPSWVHHKARNPHHWEYWTDFNSATPNEDGTFTIICKAVKMPYNYVIEMFCDFVGAGKVYSKEDWNVIKPILYWYQNCEGKRAMHPDSQKLLKFLLTMLSISTSLDDFIFWYNKNAEKLEMWYLNDKNKNIKL